MKKVIKFIYVFIIIGLESLGNMSAVTAVLEENLIKKNKYVTKEDIVDSITIARLGPGAATANMVAFLGNKIAGFWGGALATFCYTIAPLIIIISIAGFIDKFMEYSVVVSALRGCLVSVCVMFIKSTIDMGKSVLDCKFNILIFGIALIFAIFGKFSCVWIIIAAIVIAGIKVWIFGTLIKKRMPFQH